MAFREGFGLKSYFSPLAVAILAAISYAWWARTSPTVKACSAAAASAYSLIEYSWYATTVDDGHGGVRFAPGHKDVRGGFTTFEQWWANVLYMPLLLFLYPELVSAYIGDSAVVRVLLFPLNVWLLEIVEGYGFMLIFGQNPAWSYEGSDAFFHGNIKLSHLPLWLLLGVLVEVGFQTVVVEGIAPALVAAVAAEP